MFLGKEVWGEVGEMGAVREEGKSEEGTAVA